MTLEDLPITMTISQVKAKLAAEKNVENDDTLRFVWGGKNLIDGECTTSSPRSDFDLLIPDWTERTLMDYGIANVRPQSSLITGYSNHDHQNSTIEIVWRLHGGGW